MAEIFKFSNSCEYLRYEYEKRKKVNRNFSHRYIGQKIGFSPGYFSRILSGVKPLSPDMMEKFVIFFQMKHREANYFRNLVGYSQSSNANKKNDYYQKMLSLRKCKTVQLEQLNFEFFAHWSHSAIFSLCRVETISTTDDYAAIGKRFMPQLSAEAISKSLSLLEEMNIIKKNKVGTYKVVHSFLSSEGNESINIRNYLANSINGAVSALDLLPRDERKIQTMMLSLSESGYQKICSKIDSLRQEINEIVAEDKGIDRICQANFHLFPRYTK